MSDVDPGLVAHRLDMAGESIAEVRYLVEGVTEALDEPLRAAEGRVALGQQGIARAGNLAEDVAETQAEVATSIDTSCKAAASLASTVDDARLHADQLTALIDRTRTKWEAELAQRQREADALRARRAGADRKEAAGLLGQAAALEERIRCAQDALARCREAAGIAAQAGLAARRADKGLQASLGRIEEAENRTDQADRDARDAAARIDAGRQAVLAAADRLSFAKRSQQAVAEAVRSLSERSRHAERGLDDAAERLRRLDRGAPLWPWALPQRFHAGSATPSSRFGPALSACRAGMTVRPDASGPRSMRWPTPSMRSPARRPNC